MDATLHAQLENVFKEAYQRPPEVPLVSKPPWRFSGADFERMILGSSAEFTNVEHLGYEASIVVARNRERNAGRTCPDTDPAEALYRATLEAFEPPRKKDAFLEFHSSLGTSLDQRHKVDCFFWYDGIYVTIDLTTKPTAFHSERKADFVLTPDVFFADTPETFQVDKLPYKLNRERLMHIGSAIAKLICTRYRSETALFLRKGLFKFPKKSLVTKRRLQ